jgi:OmpA-OmpF porin, OOP family
MSFNLLDIVKNYATEAIVGKLAGSLGEDSGLIGKAIGAAAPALLGGLINTGSTSSGLSSIMNAVSNQDDSILDNLGGILGDSDKSSGLMQVGGTILSSLLGDKVGGIVKAVSGFSGLGGGATSSIFSFLAPVLMGVISKKVKADGLGVSGLGDLLNSQKDIVSKALPAGLGSVLGFGDQIKETVSDTVRNVPTEVEAWSFGYIGRLDVVQTLQRNGCRDG